MSAQRLEALPEIVIRGGDRPPGLWAGLRQILRYRELLVSLALREMRVRYKQSVLGIAWAVIQPVTMMFIFTIVFSRFARLPSEGLPYPIFSYAALLPWTFFSTALTSAISSLVVSGSLVKKVYFPRAVLPLASIVTYSIDFAISAGVFVLLLLYYRVHVSPAVLYTIPALALQLALMVGVSLLLAAFNAYYRDVRYVLPMLMQVWMYATPVVWSMDSVPDAYRLIYAAANPMAAVIDTFRGAVLRGAAPDWSLVAAGAATTIAVLAVGFKYFTHVERNFADII